MTILVELNRDKAADWLIRTHLPTMLEAVNKTGYAQPFRGLPPFLSVSCSGRIPGWTGVVGRLKSVCEEVNGDLFRIINVLEGELSETEGSRWYLTSWQNHFSFRSEDENEQETRRATYFASESLLPSRAGVYAERIVILCSMVLLAQHAADGGSGIPLSYRDLFEGVADGLIETGTPAQLDTEAAAC